jgi:hypothetical protein
METAPGKKAERGADGGWTIAWSGNEIVRTKTAGSGSASPKATLKKWQWEIRCTLGKFDSGWMETNVIFDPPLVASVHSAGSHLGGV